MMGRVQASLCLRILRVALAVWVGWGLLNPLVTDAAHPVETAPVSPPHDPPASSSPDCLNRWLEESAHCPTSDLGFLARSVLREALDFSRDSYQDILRLDGLYLRERARRQTAFQKYPERSRRIRELSDSLAHHVVTDPVQRVADFRDPALRVEIPAYDALNYSDEFSYSLWIHLTGEVTSPSSKIIFHSGVANGKVSLSIEPGNTILLIGVMSDGHLVRLYWKQPVEVGVWQHLALTFDSDHGFILFLDGQEAYGRTRYHSESGHNPGTGIASLDQAMYLGGFDRALPGLLDDVRVYNRELTPVEVAKLSQWTSIPNGLIGHWPMDDVESNVARNTVPGGMNGVIGESVLTGETGANPGSAAFSFSHPMGHWSSKLQDLETRLGRYEREFFSSTKREELKERTVAELRDELTKRSATLLHYVHNPRTDEVVVFCITPDREVPIEAQHLDDGESIRALVQNLQTALIGTRGSAGEVKVRAASRELAKVIWDPIAERIASEGDVWLRLDDLLHAVPYSVLIDRDGDYLVDRYAFARAGPLVSLPVKTRAATARDLDLVALGDPDYQAYPGATSTRSDTEVSAPSDRGSGTAACIRTTPFLFGTHLELEQIRSLFLDHKKTAEILEWQDASESTLKSIASRARVLHIATHGFRIQSSCLSRAPLNPFTLFGLRLAGLDRPVPDALREEDDALFSADELMRLPVDGANLVVFSACSTAIGHKLGGQQSLGLPAAAWIAGAEASLATLWNVSDDTMPDQIHTFYESWLSGSSRAEALRQTLLEAKTMTRSDRGHTHPYHWGALVIEGMRL